MANYKAVASGNWSDLAIWQDDSTGSFVASTVLPGASDDVWANGFTVDINQNIDVQSLSSANRTSTGITFDGIFQILTSGITVQAQTIWVGQRNYSYSFTINLSNGTANIVCTNFNAVNGTFGGTGEGLEILGTNCVCNLTATNMTGVAAFSSATNFVRVTSSNTLNVITTTYLVGGGTNNIINQGTTNITGNCYASSTNANAHCVSNTGTATIVGGAFGGSSAVINGGTVIASGQITNSGGNMALRATTSLRLYSTAQTQWTFNTDNLSVDQTLYTPGVATGHPAEANVRLGTVYGPTNNLTGTCAVPPAAAVSIGVPVDNTVGTAYLNATDIWNLPLASITTPNSIGERLKDASTVQTTGAQLAAFL